MVTSRRKPRLPLRVAVVGVGTWGLEHVRAWRGVHGAELVAVCDRDRDRAEEIASRFGVARWSASPASLAAEVELDIVSIVNHEAERLPATLPFLERGVHALVEKPIALTVRDCMTLRDAAKAAGAFLMPAHILRFDARLAVVKEHIDNGSLGQVRSVYARRLIPKARHAKYSRNHPALMAAIHDFDLARWYLGSEPRSVSSHVLHPPGGVVPDVLWSVLEFPGDRLAVVENAWVLPDEAGIGLEAEVEVIGSTGVARVRFPGEALSLSLEEGHIVPDTTLVVNALDDSVGALRDQLAYFARSVSLGDEPTRVSVDDGIEAVRVALAAAASGERRSPVDLQLDRMETA